MDDKLFKFIKITLILISSLPIIVLLSLIFFIFGLSDKVLVISGLLLFIVAGMSTYGFNKICNISESNKKKKEQIKTVKIIFGMVITMFIINLIATITDIEILSIIAGVLLLIASFWSLYVLINLKSQVI